MLTVVLVTGVSSQGCLLFLDPFSIKLLGRPLIRDVPIFFLIPVALWAVMTDATSTCSLWEGSIPILLEGKSSFFF